ncbi:MAG: hypothetical protein OXG81_17600, partial [Acidobacteria bacterium]|nr:hypothetical protein [Acidobacteriota bacterium]
RLPCAGTCTAIDNALSKKMVWLATHWQLLNMFVYIKILSFSSFQSYLKGFEKLITAVQNDLINRSKMGVSIQKYALLNTKG